MAASVDVVRQGIEPALTAAGVDLEDLQIRGAGRREVVRVIIDRDGGVDLDVVAEVSRQLAEILDAPPLSEQFATTYVLEVTSPGVDRPLTQAKHWRRALNRLVEGRTRAGATFSGRIVAVDGDAVTIAGDETMVVRIDDVEHAVVQVEFASSKDEPGDGDGH